MIAFRVLLITFARSLQAVLIQRPSALINYNFATSLYSHCDYIVDTVTSPSKGE